MDQNEIRNLKTEKGRILKQLQDPTIDNKKGIFHRLNQINQQLLHSKVIPYFCNHCHYLHRSGEIYQQHLIHAQEINKFLPLKWVPTAFIDEEMIIKVKPSLWTKIPASFLLKPPIGHRISVQYHNFEWILKYKRYLLGTFSSFFFEKLEPFLEETPGTLQIYLKDLHIIGRRTIEENFTNPESSKIFWSKTTEISMKLSIIAFNTEKIEKEIKNLIELAELGYPNLDSAFRLLHNYGVRYLERYLQNHPHLYLEKILMKMKMKLGIQTDANNVIQL